MKTTAQHLIVIAIIALFGINVNAQNTKSVRYHHFEGKFAGLVSERVNHAKHGLKANLKSLEAYVRFTPSEMDNEIAVSEPLTELASVVAQMATDVRFTPNTPNYSVYETDDIDLKKIKKELEKIVKFRPSETTADSSSEFDSILKELEKDVKYKPASII